MERKVKRWVKAVALAMSLGLATEPLMAVTGNPVDLNVTVTVQSTWIAASNRDNGTSTVPLGNVQAGSQTVGTVPISVTNAGNVTETYTLVIQDSPVGWTPVLTGTPVSEEYKLSGMFRAPASAAPQTTDYDDNDAFAVGTSSKTADGDNVLGLPADGSGAGAKGYQMTDGSNVNLWLKFHAPESTAVTGEQTVVVRISGQTP